MIEYGYRSAYAVVYEPGAKNQTVMCDCLRTLGFEEIEIANSPYELELALRAQSPDLLFVSVDRENERVCEIVRTLREGSVVANPFAIVVAASWNWDEKTASAFRDAGVDGLLNFPLSSSSLDDFLFAQIHDRRPFVATADYIGPDRRADRSSSGAECFKVANSLQLKLLGLPSDETTRRIADCIEASLVQMNAERQRQNVLQLYVQYRLLAERRTRPPDFSDSLRRIGTLCTDIEKRAGAAHADAAWNYCGSVRDAIAVMVAAPDEDLDAFSDFDAAMERLGEAAMSLAELFAAGATASKLFDSEVSLAKTDVRCGHSELPALDIALMPA